MMNAKAKAELVLRDQAEEARNENCPGVALALDSRAARFEKMFS